MELHLATGSFPVAVLSLVLLLVEVKLLLPSLPETEVEVLCVSIVSTMKQLIHHKGDGFAVWYLM